MIERPNCPICDTASSSWFARAYEHPALAAYASRAGMKEKLAGRPYDIRHCPRCDFHYQLLVMDDSELGGLYSPPADDSFFMAQIEKQKLHWFAHMTEEILVVRQMVSSRQPRVLDFGCNWGKWSSMALAHGCDVYAVEVNRDAADFCMRRGIKVISREEMLRMQFDFINVDQVLEHLSEPLKIARELSSCLKPDGFMKWGTPDNPALPRRMALAQQSGDDALLNEKDLDSLAPLEHVNLFSNHSLRVLGGFSGLEVVPLPFFKWMGAGQLWNLPRQFNRNLVTPMKRRFTRGTYLWFRRTNRN